MNHSFLPGLRRLFLGLLFFCGVLILTRHSSIWSRFDKIPPPPKETQALDFWRNDARSWAQEMQGSLALRKDNRKFHHWLQKNLWKNNKVKHLHTLQPILTLYKWVAHSRGRGTWRVSLPLKYKGFLQWMESRRALSKTGKVLLFRRLLDVYFCANREVWLSSSTTNYSPGRVGVEFWLQSQKSWVFLDVDSGILWKQKNRWMSIRDLRSTGSLRTLGWWKANKRFVPSDAQRQLFETGFQQGEIRWYPTTAQAAGHMKVMERWSFKKTPNPLFQKSASPKGQLLKRWAFAQWRNQGWSSRTNRPRPPFPPLRKHLGEHAARWLKHRHPRRIFVYSWPGHEFLSPMVELPGGDYILRLRSRLWKGTLQCRIYLNGKLLATRSLAKASQFHGRSPQWLRWRVRLPQGGRVHVVFSGTSVWGDTSHYSFWEMETLELWKPPPSLLRSKTLQAQLQMRLPIVYSSSKQSRLRQWWREKHIKTRGLKVVFKQGKPAGFRFLKPGSYLHWKTTHHSSTLAFRWKPTQTRTTRTLLSLLGLPKAELRVTTHGRFCFLQLCFAPGVPPTRPLTIVASKAGNLFLLSVGNQWFHWTLPSGHFQGWLLGTRLAKEPSPGVIEQLHLFQGAFSQYQTKLFRSIAKSGGLAQRVFRQQKPRLQSSQLKSLGNIAFHLTFDSSREHHFLAHPPVHLQRSLGVLDEGAGFSANTQIKVPVLPDASPQTLLFWWNPKGPGRILTLPTETTSTTRRIKPWFALEIREASGDWMLCLVSSNHCLHINKQWGLLGVQWSPETRELQWFWNGQPAGTKRLESLRGVWLLGSKGMAPGAKGVMDELVQFQSLLTRSQWRLYSSTRNTPLHYHRPDSSIPPSQGLQLALNFEKHDRSFSDMVVKNASRHIGRHGKALHLKGKGYWALKQSIGSPKMTLSLQVKPENRGGVVLASRALPPRSNWRWKLYLSGGKPCFVLYSGKSYEVCSPEPIREHVWSTLVIHLNSVTSRLKLFVNGQFQSSGDLPRWKPSGSLVFGLSEGKIQFRGLVDDLRLWNRIVSLKELQTYPYSNPRRSKRSTTAQSLDCRKSMASLQNLRPGWLFQGLKKRRGRRGSACAFSNRRSQILSDLKGGVSREISFWFQASSKQMGGLVELVVPSKGYWSWQLNLEPNRRLCFVHYAGKSREFCSKPIPLGVWNHIRLQLDWKKTRTATLFLNGKRVGSLSLKSALKEGRIRFGNTQGGKQWQGSLEELTWKTLYR